MKTSLVLLAVWLAVLVGPRVTDRRLPARLVALGVRVTCAPIRERSQRMTTLQLFWTTTCIL